LLSTSRRNEQEEPPVPHAFRKIEDSLFTLPRFFQGHSKGYRRADLITRAEGSVHMGFFIAELESGGSVDACVHSFEKGIFVWEGEIELNRDGRTIRLAKGDYALIPVAMPYAIRNRGRERARWVEKCAPQPKLGADDWQDSFFVKPLAWVNDSDIETVKTPLGRMLGHFDKSQLPPAAKGDKHRSGQTKKMLMDQMFGAQHFDLFMIEFLEGGASTMHDHNFEEAYLVVDGEVTYEAEGKKYVLTPGTIAWSGVGAPHAFYLDRGTACCWLEVMSPQPPVQNFGRRYAAWEDIRKSLEIKS
jgi:quercetin dioxygenase-like cupin family protein